MKLLSGSSNPQLTQDIAKILGCPLIHREIDKFSNGEKRIRINDELRGENVALIQSFVDPADEIIIETLLMIDALERMGVRHVSLIIPWMAYSLQDKVFREGEPISAKVIATLISNSYVKRAFLMDLHNDSIPAFFNIPTHYLSAIDIFKEFFQDNYDLDNAVVVSPDFGGLKRARILAHKLSLPLANIDKTRNLQTGEVTAVALHGEVNNKLAIIFDDVIVSGSTVIESAHCVKKAGAKQAVFASSHALLTNGTNPILQSEIDKVLITNSIEHQINDEKIEILNIAPIFASNLKNWL